MRTDPCGVLSTNVTEKRVPEVPPEQCGGTTRCRTREQKRPRETCMWEGLLSDLNVIEKGVLACRYKKRSASSNIRKIDGRCRNNEFGIPITITARITGWGHLSRDIPGIKCQH